MKIGLCGLDYLH